MSDGPASPKRSRYGSVTPTNSSPPSSKAKKVPSTRTTRLSHPRRQHYKGRHRTRPQGLNGPGDARVQRADRQRPQPLQHRATTDPGAYRWPDYSKGSVELKIHVTMSIRAIRARSVQGQFANRPTPVGHSWRLVLLPMYATI